VAGINAASRGRSQGVRLILRIGQRPILGRTVRDDLVGPKAVTGAIAMFTSRAEYRRPEPLRARAMPIRPPARKKGA